MSPDVAPAAEAAVAAVTAALLIDPDEGLRILREARDTPFGHAVPAALLGVIYGAWGRLCAEVGQDPGEAWQETALAVSSRLHIPEETR